MKEIQLTKGLVALVDDEDFKAVSQYRWHASLPQGKRNARYAKNKSGDKCVYMHRLIMSPSDGYEVDHIDGDGLNNQRSNLRLALRSQNAANMGPLRTNTSGYKGVTWNRQKRRWIAQIGVDQKNIVIGGFTDPAEAAMAYDAAALKYFGAFAYQNFPANA